jgi:hypothetical protein
MSSVDDQKRGRIRSPAYPAIGLEEALTRAKQIYEQEDRHLVAVDVAGSHWGYKPSSSGGLQIVSALKQFNLATEEGSKDRRQIRLSQLAIELLNCEENSARWRELVRTAALAPKIHGELWDRYSGHLPSDATLRMYLVVQREPIKFNKAYVDAFIGQFRSTVAFAKLSNEDIIDCDQGAANAVETDGGEESDPPETPKPSTRRPMTTGLKEDVFSLDQGVISVQWPERIQGADTEDIADWLKLVEKKIKRAVDAGESGEDRDE